MSRTRVGAAALLALVACGAPTDAPTGSLRMAAPPSLIAVGTVGRWVDQFRAETGIGVETRPAERDRARSLATAGDVDVVIAETFAGDGLADAVPGVDRAEIAWNRWLLFEPTIESPDREAVRLTASVAAVQPPPEAAAPVDSRSQPLVTTLEAIRAQGFAFVLAPAGSSARALAETMLPRGERPPWFLEAGDPPVPRAAGAVDGYGLCDEATWRVYADPLRQRVVLGGGARLKNAIVAVLVRPVTGPTAKTEPARRLFDYLTSAAAAERSRGSRVRGARVLWIGDETPYPLSVPFPAEEPADVSRPDAPR